MAASSKQKPEHGFIVDESNSSTSIITQDNRLPWMNAGYVAASSKQVECSLQTNSNSSLDTNEYAGGVCTSACGTASTNVPHSWQDTVLINHQTPLTGFVLHSPSYQSCIMQAAGQDQEEAAIRIPSYFKSQNLRDNNEENDETRLKMFSVMNEGQEEKMQYQFMEGDDTTAHSAGAVEPFNYGTFNNYFSQMINSFADECNGNGLRGTANVLDFNLNSCGNSNEMMALDGEEAADYYTSQQYPQLSHNYNLGANARNGYVHVDAGFNVMHEYASSVVSPTASLFETACNITQNGLSPPSKLPPRKRNRNANSTAELDCNSQPSKRSFSRGSVTNDCTNKLNRAANATCNTANGKELQGGSMNQYHEEAGANTNKKRPRARQGVANDPQSVAARLRRERISERLKVLQQLVPNGSKVDLVTMLEKAISYVKFLQLQLKVLTNDEYWPTETSLNKEGVKIEEAFNINKTGREEAAFSEITPKEEASAIDSK